MSSRKVILIMTDTQRTDMLGCYGNPDMKTPNMDALAAITMVSVDSNLSAVSSTTGINW